MLQRSSLLMWAPRVLAIAFAAFIGLFAADAFSGEESVAVRIGDFFLHLIPTFICLIVLLLAWRREWVGALAFTGLALFYAWWAWDHPDWILVIGGPMLVTAILYLLAWRQRARA